MTTNATQVELKEVLHHYIFSTVLHKSGKLMKLMNVDYTAGTEHSPWCTLTDGSTNSDNDIYCSMEDFKLMLRPSKFHISEVEEIMKHHLGTELFKRSVDNYQFIERGIAIASMCDWQDKTFRFSLNQDDVFDKAALVLAKATKHFFIKLLEESREKNKKSISKHTKSK